MPQLRMSQCWREVTRWTLLRRPLGVGGAFLISCPAVSMSLSCQVPALGDLLLSQRPEHTYSQNMRSEGCSCTRNNTLDVNNDPVTAFTYKEQQAH
ncbi:hypothetical protein EYF80_014163 [Liparis tanakae]|uniref:Uncharacterized protein n=1 Tax=Liparis tanakae TaxID=230148 RepID=A0A4Z2IEW1_9TELE|nr:hypothetical protein EYF80_014163 [Liparis tanakae]